MQPHCLPQPRCYDYESPIHEFPFDRYLHLRDYNRLERRRVRRLGLEPRFARRQDVTRMIPLPRVEPSGGVACHKIPVLPIRWTNMYAIRAKVLAGNSIAPFGTMQRVYWSRS